MSLYKLILILPVFFLIGCGDMGRINDANPGTTNEKGAISPSISSGQERELHEATNKKLDEIVVELKDISSKIDNLNLNLSKLNPGVPIPFPGVDNEQYVIEVEKQQIRKGLTNQLELKKYLANGEGVSQESRASLLKAIESLNLQIQELDNVRSQDEMKAWKLKNNKK